MFSLGGLKALTNGNMKIHKVLALPPSLEEDSIYFVKNGTGADLYIVDNDGSAIKASSGVDYGLTLGEDATTAYQGDRGKFAYDHAQSPHVANQTDIGLGHVNNTSDLNKPVSTATQAALDALTKTDVGLGNVDNTSDINKPVSTLQQIAIDAAGGGSSFDQDLNTTDSPTFATLTTTNTIATDVFTVDVGATGTVTSSASVIDHTAAAADDYALEIDTDAAGFGDVKAIDVVYVTGAIATGSDEAVILASIDESASTGGTVSALEVLATEGSADIDGLFVSAVVNPIKQLSGVFADMDSALVGAVNRLTEFITAGSDVQLFAADNDTVTIGNATKFEEIEFLLAVASSQSINPVFEFSTGSGTWSTFTPVDGTNGLRNNGVIAWLDGDIPTWVVGAGSEYLIRITRTRNNVTTPPTESNTVTLAQTGIGFSFSPSGLPLPA